MRLIAACPYFTLRVWLFFNKKGVTRCNGCLSCIDTLQSENDVCKRTRSTYPCTGLDRPLGLQEVESSRIFRQSAREDRKVISPKQRPSLLPRRYPWYSFLLEAESNPVT